MGSLEKILIGLPDGSNRPFTHRGTQADVGVLEQIFKNNDYDVRRLRRAEEITSFYDALKTSGETPLIIDAGANIGASAFWFSVTYPNAHTVCFEPDDGNFELLKSNTDGFDIELHKAAIGSTDGFVDLLDPGEGEWGYRTVPNQFGSVRMVSLNRIITEKLDHGYQPFIAKIDIEGGEGELFSNHIAWIKEFPLVIIELHDWLLPKKKTSASFLKAVSALERDFVHIGENIFSIRN